MNGNNANQNQIVEIITIPFRFYLVGIKQNWTQRALKKELVSSIVS